MYNNVGHISHSVIFQCQFRILGPDPRYSGMIRGGWGVGGWNESIEIVLRVAYTSNYRSLRDIITCGLSVNES